MNKYIVVSKELKLSFILKKQNPKNIQNELRTLKHFDKVKLKNMLHLAEQATDFSPAKYTTSDQSLVWSIA